MPEFDNLCRVLDVLPDGVMLVDEHQQIVYSNGIAESLFGYGDGKLTGKSLSVLIPKRSRRIHEELFARAMAAGMKSSMTERPILTGICEGGNEIAVSIAVCDITPDGRRLLVAVVRDQSRVFHALDQARSAAETDPLTGIGNRRCLSSRLRSLADDRCPFSLLYLDLDHFKQLNDHHGHAFGDAVLQVVAERLQGGLRKQDTITRIGGDEFVAVIRGVVDRRALHGIVQKIHEIIVEPVHVEGATASLGVSVGAVIGRGTESEPMLMARADAAMYQAKRDGEAIFIDDAESGE